MLMKTQPLSRCREILGLPARRISRFNSIGYDSRGAHSKNIIAIFCLQVCPRMCMKTKNEIRVKSFDPRMLMIIKRLSSVSQNVSKRKGVAGQLLERTGRFREGGSDLL